MSSLITHALPCNIHLLVHIRGSTCDLISIVTQFSIVCPNRSMKRHPTPLQVKSHQSLSTGGLSPGGLSPAGLSPGGLSPGGLSPGGLSPDGISPGGLSPGGLPPSGLSPGGLSPGDVDGVRSLFAYKYFLPSQNSSLQFPSVTTFVSNLFAI